MAPAHTPRLSKRRRSTFACVNCRERKVRCNAAFQGIPCSNCQQDGIHCRAATRKKSALVDLYPLLPAADYRRISSKRPLQPWPPDHTSEPPITSTPSTQEADTQSDLAIRSIGPNSGQSPVISSSDRSRPTAEVTPDHTQDSTTQDNADVVVSYVGESEGLEFVFDICAPTRDLKGTHYIVNNHFRKREHLRKGAGLEPVPFPDPRIREQLLRCYFHYSHPLLPVVDVEKFFRDYTKGIDHVSRVLLWSMFLTAANFVSDGILEEMRFSSRNSFKEYCYQRARETFEAQVEPDKTSLIQSAILLGLRYIDMDDRDSTWHWMGIAISLCHTLGLHRASNIDRMPRCPFPPVQRAVWKRIWWCCYYREAFGALGFGRPMRINSDDCDLPLPTTDDALADLQHVPQSIIDKYFPSDRGRLATLWINLLCLSLRLEQVLALHYRPRRPPLSLPMLEADDTDLQKLCGTVATTTELMPTTTLVHTLHLQCYHNTVIIALFRSYVLPNQEHLTPSQRQQLGSLANQRVKDAAAGVTTALNKLATLHLVHFSSNMLVTPIMMAAQIYLFVIKRSRGLDRQYASHHLNLHILVLSQLRRTYWTADYHHKLLTEVLKAIEGDERRTEHERAADASGSGAAAAAAAATAPEVSSSAYQDQSSIHPDHGLDNEWALLESSLISFNPNPFMNMPTTFDANTPEDWSLAAPNLFNLESGPV